MLSAAQMPKSVEEAEELSHILSIYIYMIIYIHIYIYIIFFLIFACHKCKMYISIHINAYAQQAEVHPGGETDMVFRRILFSVFRVPCVLEAPQRS